MMNTSLMMSSALNRFNNIALLRHQFLNIGLLRRKQVARIEEIEGDREARAFEVAAMPQRLRMQHIADSPKLLEEAGIRAPRDNTVARAQARIIRRAPTPESGEAEMGSYGEEAAPPAPSTRMSGARQAEMTGKDVHMAAALRFATASTAALVTPQQPQGADRLPKLFRDMPRPRKPDGSRPSLFARLRRR